MKASQSKFQTAHTLSVRLSIHLTPPKVSTRSAKQKQTSYIKPSTTTTTNLQIPKTHSLHDTPPLLLLLLLLRPETHHLAVVAHRGAGLVHVALEGLVEPAADETGRVACHLGVAGAALAIVFAAALVVG